jgi:hypothetical protein
MSSVPLSRTTSANERKRRRLERELRALYTMRSHLNTASLVCAGLTIPALAVACFLIAWQLHWLSADLWKSVLGALAAGLAIWWIGRRWFQVALWLTYAMILLFIAAMFESAPDVPDVSADLPAGEETPSSSSRSSSSADLPDFPLDDEPKSRRRRKLEQAIARREAMLRALQGKV